MPKVLSGKRKRVRPLTTIGEVLFEHGKIYRELRQGRLEPSLASRLSAILMNHRSMLEVALLEQQIEEMRQVLASERSIPLPPLVTQRSNGSSLSGSLSLQSLDFDVACAFIENNLKTRTRLRSREASLHQLTQFSDSVGKPTSRRRASHCCVG